MSQHVSQEVASSDSTGEAQSQLGSLLLPETVLPEDEDKNKDTPLVSAVYSEQNALFDHVLTTINGLLHKPLTGSMVRALAYLNRRCLWVRPRVPCRSQIFCILVTCRKQLRM